MKEHDTIADDEALGALEAEFGPRLRRLLTALDSASVRKSTVEGANVDVDLAESARPARQRSRAVAVCTAAAVTISLVAGLAWLRGRPDAPAPADVPSATVATTALDSVDSSAPGLDGSSATDAFFPDRWRDVITWLDLTAVHLTVDTVGFSPPGRVIEPDLDHLRDSVHEIAADAVVQQCLNSQGIVERRTPALDDDTGWPGSVPDNDPSDVAEACRDTMFESRLASIEDLPVGASHPEIDVTAYLDEAGTQSIADAIECARAFGEVEIDPATDLLGAFGRAELIVRGAAFSASNATPGTTAPATPPNPSEGDISAWSATLCPALPDGRSAIERADDAATREWMVAHPTIAAAMVEAFRHNLREYRDILANDLQYIGSVEVEGQYVGVAMRDQGGGICLMVDEFYNSSGCDTATSVDGNALDSVYSSSGDLVYGYTRADSEPVVTVDGEPIQLTTAEPVTYGGINVRMFAAHTPAGAGNVVVSVLGSEEASVTGDT